MGLLSRGGVSIHHFTVQFIPSNVGGQIRIFHVGGFALDVVVRSFFIALRTQCGIRMTPQAEFGSAPRAHSHCVIPMDSASGLKRHEIIRIPISLHGEPSSRYRAKQYHRLPQASMPI